MMQHYYERDGVRLSYYLDDYTDPWTQAPTLLLLHGAMANAQRFYSWVPGLSRDYRVVRADLRGHGLSDVPPADKPLDLQVLTEDILALLDHLGCERVHLAGNSAGGYVGQHLAMQHLQRIETLALFGSAPGLRNSQASTWLERVAEKGLRQFLADTIDDRFPPELVGTPRCEQFLDALSDHDMAYIGRFVGYMAQQEWGDQLHRITCPTLVVIPGAGRIGAMDAYQPMRDHLKRAEILVYEGERHSICEYLPQRCVADLRSFLARHGGPAWP
ncbi:alpha/beta hydrolase [Bordetella parapertussis]|uniref:Hydrolase n=2 Tax=Bordetella parapertussis TaxID=519 RepID=Q7WAF9_BORPA|nr:alpha/beta hydrolase [Bordetella parapertussis]AOB38633.1 hydrolase [Bordetella parapertussis]AUL42623.1 alpha/beta hydrolase [Bordetella parapertussis]AWP63855.1 alpha/beta hydrolase [Bordetella parapertussis]AWP71360.1 alpha/beta hydrolase [Bordetella parapertussis]AWP88625.1 alpha/beta hydrolase [Bordetella parapertussis]